MHVSLAFLVDTRPVQRVEAVFAVTCKCAWIKPLTFKIVSNCYDRPYQLYATELTVTVRHARLSNAIVGLQHDDFHRLHNSRFDVATPGLKENAIQK